jgi:ribonuclease E
MARVSVAPRTADGHNRLKSTMNEENENGSPWDSLIGDLGVEISPDALERKQPAPQELPKVVAERKEIAPPAAAPSDWGGLASELGIEVPPEEPAPPKAAPVARKEPEVRREVKHGDGPRETRQREERPRGERAKREDRPPREERSREERPAREERAARDDRPPRTERKRDDSRNDNRGRGRDRREKPVEIQTDIEFEEVIEDEIVADAGAAEPPTAEEVEKARISGEAARSAFDALFSADAVNWGSAFVSPRTNVESSFLFTEGEEAVFAEDIPETAESEEGEEGEGDETKKRPRRRRRGGRGRGRGRREDRAESTGDDDEDSAEESDESAEGEDEAVETTDSEGEERPEKRRRRRRGGRGRSRSEEDSDTSEADDSQVRRRIAAHVGEDDGDSDDDDDEDSSEEARSGHRNLPTWNDAIGVIVEGNLAQRSKAPAKQQGGPSRGRSRGGRRHKKS